MNSQNIMLSVSEKNEDPFFLKEKMKFNKLNKQIEKEKLTLKNWLTIIPEYKKIYQIEFYPLLNEMEKLQAEMVKLLDSYYLITSLNKKEKEKINYIVCELLEKLMDINDPYELKDIYNRHLESNFDQDIKQEKQNIKNMILNQLGLEIDDEIDFDSPEEFMNNMANKIKDKAEKENEKNKYKKTKKKSASMLAKEQKIAYENDKITQSIKEIYRKLVITLHPDTEQDPIERERKTEIMQKVNVAYDNNDLLTLLELQLQSELLNKDTLSCEQIKIYNKVLNEQLKSIRQQVFSVRNEFKMYFNYSEDDYISYSNVLSNLKYQINDTQKNIEEIKIDLEDFKEVKLLKKWLKSFQVPLFFNFKDLMINF